MPINDIVGEAAERQGAELMESGNAPEDDGAPDGEPEPTTMNTGPMLPPYLHNQSLDDRSAFMLMGTAIGLLGLVKQVMG